MDGGKGAPLPLSLPPRVSYLAAYFNRPRVGLSDRNSRRNSVVLPAPDGPVRNWNDLSGRWKETSRRISGPMPYLSPTFSKRITPPVSFTGWAAAATLRRRANQFPVLVNGPEREGSRILCQHGVFEAALTICSPWPRDTS